MYTRRDDDGDRQAILALAPFRPGRDAPAQALPSGCRRRVRRRGHRYDLDRDRDAAGDLGDESRVIGRGGDAGALEAVRGHARRTPPARLRA